MDFKSCYAPVSYPANGRNISTPMNETPGSSEAPIHKPARCTHGARRLQDISTQRHMPCFVVESGGLCSSLINQRCWLCDQAVRLDACHAQKH